ncbi:hypothetical protein [Streptomyces sp. NPDC096153]|uniref:hypothetical protein n=1 Tax=Streptomyces sp. NPDC096153 TaxID=3155548 RepID=UPI003320A89C
MPIVTQRHESIQYDGTNGQEIADSWLSDATLVSDNGQTLRLKIAGWPPVTYEIPLGYYVIRYYGKTFHQSVSPADYVQNWVELPEAGA